MSHLWKHGKKRAAGLTSYGLVVGLISITALTAVTGIGSNVVQLFTEVSASAEATYRDGVPDGFSFTPVNNADLSTQYLSDTITVTGLEIPADIAISSTVGAEYDVNGANQWTSAPGSVVNGDTVQMRVTTANAEGTANSITLEIGGVSADWLVGTGDFTPDAFSFSAVTGAALSSQTTSETITPTGFDSEIAVSVSGDGNPEFEINDANAWTSAPGTLLPGDTVRLRLTSSSSDSTGHTASLTLGGASGDWTVTTGDFTPDSFSFTPLVNATRSQTYTSNTVSLSGFDQTVSISISGGGNPQYSVNGTPYTSAPGTVSPGDNLLVRVTASASYSTALTGTVDVGGVTAGYTVTTEAAPSAGSLVMGNTSMTATRHGITARCAAWNGSLCTRAELTYSGTTYHGACINQERVKELFCYIATGNKNYDASGTGTCGSGTYFGVPEVCGGTNLVAKQGGMPWGFDRGGSTSCGGNDAVSCEGW